MSSLFITGNGFDIAHGIPTKYSEFRSFAVILPGNHNLVKFSILILFAELVSFFGKDKAEVPSAHSVIEISFQIVSRNLYAISMRLMGCTNIRLISSSVVSMSASKIALDASLRLSCRAYSSCLCFACSNPMPICGIGVFHFQQQLVTHGLSRLVGT